MNDTPKTPRIRVMVTPASHPRAWAAIMALHALPKEHEEAAEAVKKRAMEELEQVSSTFKERHRAAWAEIEDDLGLSPDADHSLCTEHAEDFQVAFLRDAEEPEGPTGGMRLPSGIGEMIAQALGGRMVAGDENGGVIEVKVGDNG